MLFIKLNQRQVAAYTYASTKLQNMLYKMSRARRTLENVAASSFDKSFIKCMHLFASESLQFENEINAQINSFNCVKLNVIAEEYKDQTDISFSAKSMDMICNYLDESYIKSYKQLLKDKHLSISLKSLINNQLQVFLSSLTQLRLFNELGSSLN